MQAAINLGIPKLEELRAKLQGAEGSAAATAKTMGDNLNGSLKGLGSAWDAVKNTLGEPVLPVLKSGVDELATSLRAAVENGTIAKFGTALATAFQSAIEWVRQFVASINMGQVTTDLQTFAVQAGDVFTKIGEYATNAGNIVKLVYGVMSSGTNAVLTGIYGVGSAFAGVASNIQSGLALLHEGIAKISFGPVAKAHQQAAEEIRISAKATWAASEELGKKAEASFNAMASGAQMARDGYNGLTGAAGSTKTAVEELTIAAERAKAAKEALAIAMQKEWEGLFKVREEAEKKVEADKEKTKADTAALQAMADREAKTLSLALADKGAAEATKTSAEKVEELTAQYKDAMASGDWMKAADIQAQITKEMTAAPVAVDKAAAAIKELKAQYKEAVASGDLQKAAELQTQINKEMAAAGPASQKAAGAIKDVSAAAAAVSTEVKDALASMGMEWVKLTNGIGSESAKTITNVNTIIGGLDKLKEAGVDTGRALTAALSKAIDTADSQKGLDILKQKIEQVRATLGDKIANGLLDQAKDKAKALKDELDKATPGINSVAEAMKTLGVVSDESLKQTAKVAKDAYDTVKNSGTASAAEIKESFAAAAAEKAIEAGRGIAPAWVKAEASLRGYRIETDAAGKQTLELASAVDKAGHAHRGAAGAVDQHTSALERQNAARERAIAAQEKEMELAEREAEIKRKKLGVDKDGYSVDANGNRIQQTVENANSLTQNEAGCDKNLLPVR